MNIQDLIYTRRKQLNLTLEEVANHVGVSKSTVKKWETGFIKNMRRDKVALLAEVLKIPPTSLLTDENVNSEHEHYYIDPEAAKMAQELYDNPGMRILFDAAKNVSPEDLKVAAELISRMKKKEEYEE